MGKHTALVHDLEEKMMECWNVTSDIKIVYSEHLDSPMPMSDDEIANILIGIEYLYNRKFQRLQQSLDNICKHGGVWLSPEQVQQAKENISFERNMNNYHEEPQLTEATDWSEGPLI